MSDFVKVTAARAHSNEFGDDYSKAKGDSYFVPPAIAQSLLAGGWIKPIKGMTDGDAGDVHGGQGYRTGAGAAGESGDAEIDGTAST